MNLYVSFNACATWTKDIFMQIFPNAFIYRAKKQKLRVRHMEYLADLNGSN